MLPSIYTILKKSIYMIFGWIAAREGDKRNNEATDQTHTEQDIF